MPSAWLMVLSPDLAAAGRFYGDVLGFEQLSAGEDMLEFRQGDAVLRVFRCAGPAPESRHGEAAASVFVFEVPDIEARMSELRARGVEFLHQTPAANALGRYAAFRAPGGLVHEIFEPAPKAG